MTDPRSDEITSTTAVKAPDLPARSGRRFRWGSIAILIPLVVVFVALSIGSPAFLSPRNLSIVLDRESAPLLIADEPTRGVDVGSRRAIYDLIAAQAAKGIGVLVISSDAEEVIGLAHRILVIRGGRVVAELEGDAMTEQNIITAAFAEPTETAPQPVPSERKRDEA